MIMLKVPADFQRVSRLGKKWHGGAFVMQSVGTGNESPFRLGLTVSRRVGNAVVRNRARRRLRETARLFLQKYPLKGCDVVLIAKPAAAAVAFARIGEEFAAGLRALGVTA